jgi:hypothetical protein
MIYYQRTGKLIDDDGMLMCTGYSGLGEGKNNPDMQDVKAVGPIPRGEYSIGRPYDSKNTGPLTIMLFPNSENEMFGRGDFRIHGDSIKEPGTASHGCIIAPRAVRDAIVNGTDKKLIVK